MYKLNNIELSNYGIYPRQAPGQNIAVAGMFDMPKRTGDTHNNWAESDSLEPFVDNDELFFEGRTITFYGYLVGDTKTVKGYLNSFKTALKSYTNLVPFETPFGTACVRVLTVDPKLYNGGATIRIEFREPIVGAICGVVTPETLYDSAAYSETAIKNNCGSGYNGSEVTLTAPQGKFSSPVSQEAANLLAIQWVRATKQAYANANGSCIAKPPVYYNVKLRGELQKNDCANGEVGSTVTYEVPAFKYSSDISQADADAQAQAEIDATLTQAYANENGVCNFQFWNELITITLEKEGCAEGYKGSVETFNIAANLFSSFISQDDANTQARNSADMNLLQNLANTQGVCIKIIPSKVTYRGVYGSSNFRYMQWRIDHVNPDAKFIFIAYGVFVEYEADANDTPADVVTALINLINGTTLATWRSENQMPLSYAKPQALQGPSANLLNVAYYNTSMKIYVTDNDV